MAEIEAIGILRRYLGESRFVTDRGTFRLTNVPRAAQAWTGFARVRGTLTDKSCLDAGSVELLGENESGSFPYHFGSAADPIWAAGRLRATAHQFLWKRGFTEMFLPSTWPRSDGADGSEVGIAHPAIEHQGLRLQRSSEASTYVALASGLTNWYSFARCWQAEPEPNVHPKDDLLEYEQLTIARAGWSLDEMMDVASNLVGHLAGSVGLQVPRGQFRSRDLSREAADEHFSRTVQLPSGWGSEVRQVVFDRLRRLRCEYAEGAGGDLDCIRVSGPAASSSLVENMVRAIESASSTDISAESLRALKLHPTWVMYPPLTGDPEQAGFVNCAVNRVFTARLAGVDPPRLLHAALNIAGLEVGRASIYADARTLGDNVQMMRHGGALDFGYLTEMLDSAPPGMGAISFVWERLCSRLAGSSDSAGVQAIGRLAIGGRPSKPVGPK